MVVYRSFGSLVRSRWQGRVLELDGCHTQRFADHALAWRFVGDPGELHRERQADIAVPVGWGGWVKGFAPGALGVLRGDALMVFALC